MKPEQLLATDGTAGLETEAEFTRWVRHIVKGAAELQAFEAGQIDAILDPATGSAILSPEARGALPSANQLALGVFDALPGEVCVLDASGITLMTNRAWRVFTAAHSGAGLSVRQGANFLAACRDAPPKERAHATALAAGFHQVISGELQQFRQEYICHDAGGGCAFILTVARIASDGAVHALVARENTRKRNRADASRRLGTAEAPRLASLGRAGTPNRMLSALPEDEYERLFVGFEPVKLTYGEVLYETGEPIRYVYFPNDCPVSLLTVVEGRSLEVGLIGPEGLVGSRLALGGTTSPGRALVQGSGTAVRMKATDFLRELERSPALRRALLRSIDSLMIQVIQNAACNRFHTVVERLARWLLMTRDRSPSNKFYLTQNFLADMLGTRRESVTEAANVLKHRNLMDYSRGKITILDRRGLEAAACSCYRRLKAA